VQVGTERKAWASDEHQKNAKVELPLSGDLFLYVFDLLFLGRCLFILGRCLLFLDRFLGRRLFILGRRLLFGRGLLFSLGLFLLSLLFFCGL
jgi:hypothetical protein